MRLQRVGDIASTKGKRSRPNVDITDASETTEKSEPEKTPQAVASAVVGTRKSKLAKK